MHTKLLQILTQRNLTILGFGIACTFGSFLIGIRSAGEVQTFERSEAQQANLLTDTPGDVDGNGRVELQDAVAALEISLGAAEENGKSFRADTDGDGKMTPADALWILGTLKP